MGDVGVRPSSDEAIRRQATAIELDLLRRGFGDQRQRRVGRLRRATVRRPRWEVGLPDAQVGLDGAVSAIGSRARRGIARAVRARGAAIRPVATAVLALLLALALGAVRPSSAQALPPIVAAHMEEVEEWAYRNGAVKNPMGCGVVCSDLWKLEHEAGTEPGGAVWDDLGALQTEHTHLWSSMLEFQEGFLGAWGIGASPFRVGWEIGGGESKKWMELHAPEAPLISPPSCSNWDITFKAAGQEIFTSGYEHAYAPEHAWYLDVCGNSEKVYQLVAAENPENPTSHCNGNGGEISGWTLQQWWWNLCFEGYYRGEEVLARSYAQAFYKKFHFARPDDWSNQKLTGELYRQFNTRAPSDPGIAAVLKRTEEGLAGEPALSKWLEEALRFAGLEEEFGDSNPAAPYKCKACAGKPVNSFTGNQFETQTDLAVGGRGPGLALTRTYNSQQAAFQSAPGIFGYGWTGPGNAWLQFIGESMAVVHQDNGSAVRFLRVGEAWVPRASLIQATLTQEGSSYVYALPDQTTLHFNSTGQLTSESDRNGNALSFGRNVEGRLESISDGAGRKLSFAYNAGGQVESATDPMGHVVKYAYEGGQLISVTEPGETTPNWRFKYDASHQLIEQTDGLGHAVTTEYDTKHRAIRQLDALERQRKWKYTTLPSGSETSITEPNGSLTVERFNSAGLLTSVTRASGSSLASKQSYTYDAANNLTSLVDPNNHTTKYGYNSAGDRTSETDPLGHKTEWTYNATHDVVATKRPSGETTTIERDTHGNVTAVSRPAPGPTTQTTKFKYDAQGDLESATDPLERTRTYTYDTYGDRASETDPEGNERTWAYDEDSRETSSVSPRGNVAGAEASKFTSKVERDAQERPITVTDPLGHTTKHAYDAAGNLESVTDANGHTTTYTYDADNERIKTKEPNGTLTETGYDSEGRVTSQTDGNKHTTKYARNALEEVSEVTDPLSRKATKEYDAKGNLTKRKDAAGRTTTYAYDEADRLKELSYSDGKTPAVKYEYDVNGNRTKMVDGTGTSTYAYDQLDRLTEAKDGHGDIVGYEYDLADEQTKLTYPNGKSVTRAFDSDGRLKSVTDWLEHTSEFAYDPDSDPSSTTFPSGTGNVDTYAYDDADQMSEVKMTKGSETLASISYTRDNDGQVTSADAEGLPGLEAETAYTYDPSNRLTKAGNLGSYEYDAADNPTKIGASSYSYDAASQLTSSTLAAYTYDQVGERTKTSPVILSATSYGYDQAGNLTSVTRPGEPLAPAINDTYAYDGTGLRASQTISGATTYLTWDASGTLPLILNDGQYSFIYGPGNLPVEQVSTTGQVLYLHHDQQGSTRLLSGSSGANEGATTFDAYGNVIEHSGTAVTPLGYDGQYTSADTGLIYLRSRTYDPATAQFLSTDPIVAITRAPYGYASQNPVNVDDPSGLDGFLDLGIGPDVSAPSVELPSLEQIGTRFVGFVDGVTSSVDPVGYGTADVRNALGLNGGLETCSSEYKTANTVGDIDGYAVGALTVVGSLKTAVERWGLRAKAGFHPPHHTFRVIGPRRHFQVTIWRDGVKHSDHHLRIPLP
jgi:RHS repeat-associated protein